MVSTRQAGKTRKVVEEGSHPIDTGEEYEEPTPEFDETRSTKRARTAKTTAKGEQEEKRRKKTKLSMLPEMPVDILYEVRRCLLRRALPDTSTPTDILSRPPKGPDAYLLDGEGVQPVPHYQIIETCLAGLVRHDPEE